MAIVSVCLFYYVIVMCVHETYLPVDAKAMFPHIWKHFYILEADHTWLKIRLC
jgi:hypothetical protein